jgi:hypothetical protein
MNIPFLDLIQRGTKAVPATKYAVDILGMVAVVALIAQFKLDWRLAVFGTIIPLGLMVLLVIFAKFSQTAPAKIPEHPFIQTLRYVGRMVKNGIFREVI